MRFLELQKFYKYMCCYNLMADNNSEPDIQFIDTENFHEENTVFNHQTLVMTRLNCALEAGSHELRSGWFNESTDKLGNVKRVYIEDTRMKFIESVKSCQNVMECDYDEEARKIIEEYEEELLELKENLLEDQWKWYTSLRPNNRQGIRLNKDTFHFDMVWYAKYLEYRIEWARAVLTELNKLTKRLRFYQENPADFIA